MISPIKYLGEVAAEMSHVSWPGARIVAMHTGIVIVSMIITLAVVGSIDAGLVELVKYILLKG